MKNQTLIPILLPTDDASSIVKFIGTISNGTIVYEPTLGKRDKDEQNQHIYLCSNQRIKEGEWRYCYFTNQVTKYDPLAIIPGTGTCEDCRKIEFTTDLKLIADGVQKIDGKTKAITECDFCNDNYSERCTQCGGDLDYEVCFLEEFCKRYNQKDNQKSVDVEKLAEQLLKEAIIGKSVRAVISREDALNAITKAIQSNEEGFSLEQAALEIEKQSLEYSSNILSSDLEKSGYRKQYGEARADFTSGANFILEKLQSLAKPKADIIIECEVEEESRYSVSQNGYLYSQKIKLNKDGQPILTFK